MADYSCCMWATLDERQIISCDWSGNLGACLRDLEVALPIIMYDIMPLSQWYSCFHFLFQAYLPTQIVWEGSPINNCSIWSGLIMVNIGLHDLYVGYCCDTDVIIMHIFLPLTHNIVADLCPSVYAAPLSSLWVSNNIIVHKFSCMCGTRWCNYY